MMLAVRPSLPVRVAAIPSITIFVRHSAKCPRKGDEFYKNCKCPKHLRWSHGGKQERQTAKTRSWSIAEQARRQLEAQFDAADPAQPLPVLKVTSGSRSTIEQAVQLFLSEKKTQGVDATAQKKYERELNRLSEF